MELQTWTARECLTTENNYGQNEQGVGILHELFVATDWGERFAELIDEHVTLPKEGRALYLGSGTGGHAIALQERAGDDLKFLGIDENEEYLELARAKAIVVKDGIEFNASIVDRVDLPDNQFKLVLGDVSLTHVKRAPKLLAEVVRVAAPGGVVALALPTFSSFGEFFSIYWEALHNCDLLDHESEVERLISTLPSPAVVEEMAERAGLEEVSSWTRIEEFDYESAEKFLNDPLIADFLMQIWLESLSLENQNRVVKELGRLISEERHEAAFALSLKATLMVGKKALNH